MNSLTTKDFKETDPGFVHKCSVLFWILSQDPDEGERRERKWHKGLFKQFILVYFKIHGFYKTSSMWKEEKEIFFYYS